MDEWRPIKTKRFDGESREAHQRRATRIAEIIADFRMGRLAGDHAEQMERKLVELQTPALEHTI